MAKFNANRYKKCKNPYLSACYIFGGLLAFVSELEVKAAIQTI